MRKSWRKRTHWIQDNVLTTTMNYRIILLCCLPLFLTGCLSHKPYAAPPADAVVLQKKAGREFIILNLSDPQMSVLEWTATEGAERDNRVILKRTVSELVSRVKPDLITISGDLSGDGHEAYRQLADFLDTFGIPWAPVWGNHDNEAGVENIKALEAIFSRHPLCLFQAGPPELGSGNYVLRIIEGVRPVTALFLVDTHDRVPWPTADDSNALVWAKLWPTQFDWYRRQVAILRQEGFHDSAMIMHIPIYAYNQAFEAAYDGKADCKELAYSQTLNGACWKPEYKEAFGCCHESICSHPADDGAFAVLLEEDFTKTLLCGHDHVNNFVIPYRGIRLAYSLKTGPGCYWEAALNGGTVLVVGSDGICDIRHEFVDVALPAAEDEK